MFNVKESNAQKGGTGIHVFLFYLFSNPLFIDIYITAKGGGGGSVSKNQHLTARVATISFNFLF